MSLLPDAVRAQQKRFHIFPINPAGTVCPETGQVIDKMGHLLKRGKPWKIRWSEVATDDLTTILGWWQKSPRANIGVAAKQSGLLVVDCDVPKADDGLKGTPYEHLHDAYGPRPHGDDVFNEMCHRYGGDWAEITETYRVATGSGGLHYYYTWPPGLKASQGSPVPGFVDVRCNGGDRGGYVLGAGSQTAKGHYIALNNKPVAPAPRWLVELVREWPRPPAPPRNPVLDGGGGNFSGLEAQVRHAAEGNRNNVLLWAARAMCSDGASQSDAEQTLIPAAVANGLRESEATATVRSAYRLQRQKEGS